MHYFKKICSIIFWYERRNCSMNNQRMLWILFNSISKYTIIVCSFEIISRCIFTTEKYSLDNHFYFQWPFISKTMKTFPSHLCGLSSVTWSYIQCVYSYGHNFAMIFDNPSTLISLDDEVCVSHVYIFWN